MQPILKHLTFTTDHDRRVFEQLWDTLILGAQAGTPAGKSRVQIRREATLQRKLMAISHPTLDPDRTMRPPYARSLAPGPQELLLTIEEVTLAMEFAEKVPWGGALVVAVADLFDVLESAPTVQEGALAIQPAPQPDWPDWEKRS